jgi:methyltransferase-like protein 6
MNACKDVELPEERAKRCLAHANLHWDVFYRCNRDRFFKNRHWLVAEFPQLVSALRILEVGSGVGDSICPLLPLLDPRAHIYACDFAPSAIEILRNTAAYASGRITAFVADITSNNFTTAIPAASIDACTMIFVLSALHPADMATAVANVARTVKSRGEGRVFFRDYARGDLAVQRFNDSGRQQRIASNLYARSDSTLAYYFAEDEVKNLFESQGFVCEDLQTVRKLVVNRKLDQTMERLFIQAVFALSSPRQRQVTGKQRCAQSTLTSNVLQQAESNQAYDDSRESLPASHGRRARMSPNQTTTSTTRRIQLGGMSLHCELPSHFDPTEEFRENGPHLIFSRALFSAPGMLQQRTFAEVRCGALGLPTLAALRWCRMSVATDPKYDCIQALKQNVRRNGHLFVFERLRLQAVASGPPALTSVAKVLGGGADVVACILSNTTSADTKPRVLYDIVEECRMLMKQSVAACALLVVPLHETASVIASAKRNFLRPAEVPNELQVALQELLHHHFQLLAFRFQL